MKITEETNEIFHLCSVINMFLKNGITRFDLQDIKECAEELKDVKAKSVDRWLSNPFFVKLKCGDWLFKFGRNANPSFGSHPLRKDYGLEFPLDSLGLDFFVKWARIWCSGYTELAVVNDSTTSSHRDIVAIRIGRSMVNAFRMWSQGCLVTSIQVVMTLFLEDLLKEECKRRGHPDYHTAPPTVGRKTTLVLTRNTLARRAPLGVLVWQLPQTKAE